jgi:hypothetical protein
MGRTSTLGTRWGLSVQGDNKAAGEMQAAVGADPEELNQIVLQIGRLVIMAGLEAALRVGALIVHHFYGGNAEGWRERGPKTVSFRQLAEHPGLPMSPGALYRCVAIFELCDRLGAPSRWRNLGASHFRVVLGLDAQTQERLLGMANSERWSVRALQAEVTKRKPARHNRGGRRPQSPVTKIVTTIRRCVEEYGQAIELFEDHDVEEFNKAVDEVDAARACLAELREALRTKATAAHALATSNSSQTGP